MQRSRRISQRALRIISRKGEKIFLAKAPRRKEILMLNDYLLRRYALFIRKLDEVDAVGEMGNIN